MAGGRGSDWSSSIRGVGAICTDVVEVDVRWARRELSDGPTVTGERSPSDCGLAGRAGKNIIPAAALNGYATAAT